LLRRGRVRDAQAALDEARQFASRSGHESTLTDIAVMSGEALIDLARLDEAEAMLTTARSAAYAAGDEPRAALAALGLGRCLFWRGRYADAVAALTLPPGREEPTPAIGLRRRLLTARAAVGQRDFSSAMSLIGESAETPGIGDQPSWRSMVACSRAFVHLAVGDLDAVERDVAAAISASRAAYDPLRAVRARLLLAEAERRRGRASSAVSHLRRLANGGTIRSHARARPARQRSRRAVRRCGGHRHPSRRGDRPRALALYAPDRAGRDRRVIDRRPAHQRCRRDPADVPDRGGRGRRLEGGCAAASGDSCTPRRLPAWRSRTAATRRSPATAATSSRRRRAREAAGITIAPCRGGDGGRLEAASPIHYGGDVIGVVGARWAVGSTYDLTRAAAVLTITAAAVAPLLSAAITRRERVAVPALSELRGLTPAMAELDRPPSAPPRPRRS
jgi:tetratricopeptide (TPR) repeat protein